LCDSFNAFAPLCHQLSVTSASVKRLYPAYHRLHELAARCRVARLLPIQVYSTIFQLFQIVDQYFGSSNRFCGRITKRILQSVRQLDFSEWRLGKQTSYLVYIVMSFRCRVVSVLPEGRTPERPINIFVFFIITMLSLLMLAFLFLMSISRLLYFLRQ
jgi:hypothetical protein